MEPTFSESNPTPSRLRKWIGILRYEHWLILVAILLLCLVAGLAFADSQGLIDYGPKFYAPVSYVELCPQSKSRPLLLSQNDINNGRKFGQVVAGLGVPEFVYHNNYVPVVREATYVHIGLDYPKLGVSVWSGRWYKGDDEHMQARLTANLQVQGIDCYPPTQSMEEVLRDVYHYRTDIIESEMKHRIPWPGFDTWLP